MAETENIAKIAEKISKEIFQIFGWEVVGPMNVNWDCVNPEHKAESGREKYTHPSDIVFKYKEPYSSKTTYLNVDLKSYSSSTITPLKVKSALKSLSMAVSCAERSKAWKTLFLTSTGNISVNGLLFIYNHDGEYKGDFDYILDGIDIDELEIPKGHKLYVLDPRDINYLISVVSDIKIKRGDDEIPKGAINFYYPDLVEKRTNSSETLAASIEMLQSPYISFKYNNNNKKIHRLYYRDSGNKIDDFLYLFDYLFHYQQFQECDEIIVSMYDCDNEAFSLFENAKSVYAETKENEDGLSETLKKIRAESVSTVYKKFSTIEIGMEDRNE